jgi:hypothetical protein
LGSRAGRSESHDDHRTGRNGPLPKAKKASAKAGRPG